MQLNRTSAFPWDNRHTSAHSKSAFCVGSNWWMGMGFYFRVMKVFWNWVEVVVAQYCECSKCHWIAHFKMVHFMLVEFYLNKTVKQNALCIISISSQRILKTCIQRSSVNKINIFFTALSRTFLSEMGILLTTSVCYWRKQWLLVQMGTIALICATDFTITIFAPSVQMSTWLKKKKVNDFLVLLLK